MFTGMVINDILSYNEIEPFHHKGNYFECPIPISK